MKGYVSTRAFLFFTERLRLELNSLWLRAFKDDQVRRVNHSFEIGEILIVCSRIFPIEMVRSYGPFGAAQ